MTLRRALATLAFVLTLLVSVRARAFEVPELSGRVVDQAGKLTDAERATVEAKLAAFDQETTNQIVVFITPSLQGQTIEDVSYKVAKKWGLGKAGKDNGVLLTIATNDRRIRIETGKGVGDRLTDLQSNDIIMKRIGPELKRENFFLGINNGLDDIIGALHPGWTYEGKRYLAPAPPERSGITIPIFMFFVIVFFVLFTLSIVRRLRGNAGWSTGTGVWSSSDSSWSSGGGDSGGSGFSGGGGDFGGGGSSGSY